MEIQQSPQNDLSARVNVQYLYAASPGHTVDSGNQPGPFATALIQKLPLPDIQFSDVAPEINNYVTTKTKFAQSPWLSGSSSAEIYFNPSPSRVTGERELWESALAAGDVDTISAFRWRYSVSRFVHAARQWLEDHGEPELASLTRVSPLAPELAWVSATAQAQSGNPSTVMVARFEGPLAFSRDYLNSEIKPSDIETADVVATQQVKRSPRTIADIFAKHGEAVLTGPVTAVDRPIRGASAVAELKSGTKLTVVEAKNHGADQAWVKVRAPGLDRTAYIPLSGNTVVKTTNIGKPLKEIVIGGVRGSIEGRVDTAPATEGLQELRSAGRSVAWISISTPKADDQSARELFTLRVADLIHALDEQGVPRQRISVAGEDSELPHDQIRMRIFGN